MSSPSALRLRALARAVELSGGPKRLAQYLGTSTLKITFLLQGASQVPEELFLQVVDLLTHHDVGQLIARGQAKPVEEHHGD